MSQYKPCPSCGQSVFVHKNPVPTVDVIIYFPPGQIVLVERRKFPQGWALPGGFVDYGEKVESAAVREAREETGLDVVLTRLLGVYSQPDRDPRQHTLSVVFTAQAANMWDLAAGDDAGKVALFHFQDLPELAFDHARIISDFKKILEKLR